jgi:glycosyltransferase involved in cell wall biosynthesis
MGRPEPMVSVVVPAFNRRDALLRCLSGIARQTYPRLEVIVVDDGSSDGTEALLEQLAGARRELALRWVRHGSNLGANAARNTGARIARGDVVAFLDSDAVPEPGWAAELVSGFDEPSVAAVTGRVEEPAPRNVYELAYKGTHCVHDRGGEARRLVAGNLAIRRHLLLALPLEEDLKYGCNEEGIFLRLGALGYRQRFIPSAVIVHDHPYDRSEFLRRARVLGRASAWLVYKYRLPPRLDLLPLRLGHASLALSLLDARMLWPAACFLLASAGALAWNDMVRKRKTAGETLRSFAAVLAFYHVKLFWHVVESARLRLRPNRIERVRLRDWARECALRLDPSRPQGEPAVP